jgi:hypothetical protein
MVAAAVAPVFVALACSSEAAAPGAETEATPLPAPVITQPVCGAVIPWPEGQFTLAWEGVAAASSYTVEVDCLSCGDTTDAWYSQSGTPWRVMSRLSNQDSSLRTDVVSSLRREGGRTMRWRVWAVDRLGGDGHKSDWCVVPFSEDGLRTPSAGGPGPDQR